MDAVETSEAPVVAAGHIYADGDRVAEHSHGRAQLLCVFGGAVTVSTREGSWMVPPDHALWIPAFMPHGTDMIGDVRMSSAYVRPEAVSGLPARLVVTGLTSLMRSLIAEAVLLSGEDPGPRARHIFGALLHEIPHLPERPLGLPFPTHGRLAALCRDFVSDPSAHTDIDDWAAAAGMSRRTFTRAFRQETGLSLSTWRQQACLLAALPRLGAGEAVTTVALDLGYDSVPAFTHMFRRMLGQPPRSYFRGQQAVA
ncbi:AraC family transcriptional regulator [Pseudohoeflea suaedae]|uniref:AraC family transcriptional regulator n=2 Tax=Pseudohoeflea suaedae TaxID=877384 RepID=A0A4V3A7P0_9HYPH|nr:helix-turn-helix transcriptional regulator [Pseudohoeflea suaedae]TDH39505.1 AraC family transcriptional regulator [Pseudohoeflea suaedae]